MSCWTQREKCLHMWRFCVFQYLPSRVVAGFRLVVLHGSGCISHEEFSNFVCVVSLSIVVGAVVIVVWLRERLVSLTGEGFLDVAISYSIWPGGDCLQ